MPFAHPLKNCILMGTLCFAHPTGSVQEGLGSAKPVQDAAFSIQIDMRSDAARSLNLHQQFTRFLQSMETVIDATVLQ